MTSLSAEFRNLYEAWVSAVSARDRNKLMELFAEDYVYTGHNGVRLVRDEIVDAEMDVPIPGLPFLDLRLQDLGDFVIARGEHTVVGEVSAERFGDEVASKVARGSVMAFTTVWRRSEGNWTVVSNDAHITD